MAALGTQDLAAFQKVIAARLGLHFDESRLTFLAEAVARRLEARRQSPSDYLATISRDLDAEAELGELARELTVGETYFFRHADQFSALGGVALPERQAARAASRRLRLLSAGCASGEEAYSMAILVRELGIEPAFDVRIVGVDVNAVSLEMARRGCYSSWSLRETSLERRQRWFQGEGRSFTLAPSLRAAVQFERQNLMQDSAGVLGAGSLDVIFCRNVLMYFTPEHATAVVARLARALAPGGFLFLGHAETLRGLSHAFQLRHTHNTFYYQLKGGAEHAAVAEPSAASAPASTRTRAPVGGDWMGTWLDTVERSSERIEQLSKSRVDPAPQVAAGARHSGGQPAADLSQSLELLRHERFAEALELLRDPSVVNDSAALLLRAALLTHQGAVEQAERACHDLIRMDDLNAGAHYVLALCLEQRGRSDVAIEHDRIAIYLDPGFAMPHLHLGLMARRRGDAPSARHELGQALQLLEREDESRLLLFGGGFSREALLALCRSELSSLRGVT